MYFASSSFGQPVIVNELFCQLQVTGLVIDFPIWLSLNALESWGRKKLCKYKFLLLFCFYYFSPLVFIASYNTGKYGDPTWRWGFSCLCSHGLHSIHVNLIIHDFLGKEECRLHAVCNYFSHSFTARDTMWDLQMLKDLSLHQLKQKMLTICNFNLFILKQCKAMQRYRRAVGESIELTLHTQLFCETEELRITRI